MPAPVLTFTANPLAESTLDFPDALRLGVTQRARAQSFQVGGKGFNVAKMLHRLGGEVTAVSFAGSTSGEACRRWLTAHAAYPWHLVPMLAPTREGFVARTPDGLETTFLGPDCTLDAQAAAAAADLLLGAAGDPIIALCGSLPGWSDSAYSKLRDVLLRRLPAARLVVDTYGPALAELVQRPVALVKINRQEFSALAAQLGLPAKLSAVARSLPVDSWIITDGGREIEYLNQEVADRLSPPPLTEVSATGSGDVFLATLLAGAWQDPAAWPALLARAADFAARNAAHPRIAEFELPT